MSLTGTEILYQINFKLNVMDKEFLEHMISNKELFNKIGNIIDNDEILNKLQSNREHLIKCVDTFHLKKGDCKFVQSMRSLITPALEYINKVAEQRHQEILYPFFTEYFKNKKV